MARKYIKTRTKRYRRKRSTRRNKTRSRRQYMSGG